MLSLLQSVRELSAKYARTWPTLTDRGGVLVRSWETAFSSTWNPARKRTRQIRYSCVRKIFRERLHWAGLTLRRRNTGGPQRDARRHTCTASLFVQSLASASNSAVRRERLRLYFVARQGMGRAFGYKANVLLLSPISSSSKYQPSQPTAAPRMGPRVRCDYYVFMTAVVDIRLVTKKCRSFTNLQT
jgi:hypothetical protein